MSETSAIWKKAWWECRSRAALIAGVGAGYVAIGILLMATPLFSWERYCQLIAGVVVPVAALVFAGSGVNSQSRWGTTTGFHPSMYFFLSLPVSRRRALAARTAMGAVLTVVFTAAVVGALGAVTGPLGVKVPAAHVLASIVFMTVGAFGIFALETFLTTLMDEVWAGIAGYLFTGILFGMGWSVRHSATSFQPLKFVTGALWNQQGTVGWGMLAFFLGIGAAFLWASFYVVERKEY